MASIVGELILGVSTDLGSDGFVSVGYSATGATYLTPTNSQ